VNAVKELKQSIDDKDRKIKHLEVENASIKAYLCGRDPSAVICQ
jgi:hypothetical protein